MRLPFAWALAGFVLLAGLAAPAQAHQFRPTLLRVSIEDSGNHQLTWKWDALDPVAISGLELEFSDDCSFERHDISTGPDRLAAFEFSCGDTPLVLRIPRSPSELVLDLRKNGEPLRVERLAPTPLELRLSEMAGQAGVGSGAIVDMRSWFELGVEHIWFGWDHLAFVIALTFLVSVPRRIALIVTGFTLGHTVTLVGATLSWVPRPSEAPVEAIIALSILYIAMEMMRDQAARTRFAQKIGFAVSAGFGLIHGFGFAGALAEFSLPPGAELPALVSFNVGVEAGQLAVVLVALMLRALYRKLAGDKEKVDRQLRLVTAYMVGSISVFWAIERIGWVLFG